LQPQRRTLANCGQLRRLKVRKAQRGQVAVLARKRGKAVDHDREFLEDESESGAEEDEVGVASMTRWKIRKASGCTDCVDRAYSVT